MRYYKNIIYNWKRKFGKNRHFWRKKRGLDLLEFCMQATSFKGKNYNEGRKVATSVEPGVWYMRRLLLGECPE